MSYFVLNIQDSQKLEQFADVELFSASDKTGSFNILAGHERFITVLEFGLAKFQCKDQSWQYLAMPGAVLYFCNNQLSLNSRLVLRDHNYEKISQLLMEQIHAEEQQLHRARSSLHQLETELLKRLWRSDEHRSWL